MDYILLVEDDPVVSESIKTLLENEGFKVNAQSSVQAALKELEGETFNLALLDVGLPDGNGYAICSKIRQHSQMPVIFITALSDEPNVITGFSLGANDYITKPFRSFELIARIKNLLRQTQKNNLLLRYGDLCINTTKNIVTKKEKEVPLSALEHRILSTFIDNKGITLSRDKLLESIWEIAGNFVYDNTLTVCIKRLREKLETDPTNPQIIKTVRGVGYVFGDGR